LGQSKDTTLNSDTEQSRDKTYADCHKGITEIYPHLFVGKNRDYRDFLDVPVDVLVPLDSLDGRVWDTNWRGEIMYVPIEDYDILPEDVLKSKADKVTRMVQAGLNVGIFCLGGHGRTGYFTAVVLGMLGQIDPDPVTFLRKNYCEEAVETAEQRDHIAEVLNMPEIKELYVKPTRIMGFRSYGLDDFTSWGYGDDWGYSYGATKTVTENRCNNCVFFTATSQWRGTCFLKDKGADDVLKYAVACKEYISIHGEG